MFGRRMVRQPVLLAVLLLLSSGASPAGAERTAASHSGWYFSAMEHDHDMASHEGHHLRSWQPEHDVDPATITAYQVMYEVTRFPNREPTREQRRRATDLVRRCRESARRH